MATLKSGLNSGSGFSNSDTITSTTLNNHVNNGGIVVGTIATADLSDSSSKTTGVTFAKMQHISTAKVLGRTTASEGDVEEVSLLDEDNMSSDSATAVATQQSIKAYVDAEIAKKKRNCLVTNTSSSIAVTHPTILSFDSEISDTNNLHDNSTNNSRITVDTTGVYIINGIVATDETDNGDYSVAIRKNGTELCYTRNSSSTVGSPGLSIEISHTALLSSSDYIELELVKTSGTGCNVIGTKTFFSASLVS
jgi:hypothetical protein